MIALPARFGRGRPASGARHAGFTLIELLVVVLLVALLASFAMLTLPGDSPRSAQREEARRVFARMDLAREEAVMQARSLGVRFADGGYRFFAFAEGAWRPLESDRLLVEHEFPESISVDIEIEGQDIALGGEGDDDGPGLDSAGADASDEEEDAVRPQIFFLAGGEIVPSFTIRVLSEETDSEWRIAPGDQRWLTLEEQRF